jgi:uncharacterized protein (DUF302 family)
MTAKGTNSYASNYDPAETLSRLSVQLVERRMTIFSTIDHGAAADNVGMALRPTVVIAFGNPLSGTLLMQLSQTIGIDLPLKALIWEDVEATTWLTLSDPLWLAAHHGITVEGNEVIQTMSTTLREIVRLTTGS